VTVRFISWLRRHRYVEERGAEDEEGHNLVIEVPAESGDERIDEIKRAAAEDVAAIEEDNRHSRRPDFDDTDEDEDEDEDSDDEL
jgi:hypothetical protein